MRPSESPDSVDVLPLGAQTLTVFSGLLGASPLEVRRRDDDGENPALDDLGLALPRKLPTQDNNQERTWCLAAAAHAAAHRRFPRPPLDRDRLTPIAQVLMGALEDARAEWHLAQEFPGVAHWWQPQHRATSAWGNDFLALLARLARRLADPNYLDDHPWIAKGEALVYTDANRTALAEPRGDETWLRQTASRLGHDIGQMRLPFNPRTYTVEPSYRDDHRWLWQPKADAAESPVIPPPEAGPAPDDAESLPTLAVHRHPEWDRLIGRHRPAWTTVHEKILTPPRKSFSSADRTAALHQLARVVPALTARQSVRRHRQVQGDELDLGAAVAAWIDRRLGRPVDDRVYRDVGYHRAAAGLVVMVDASASTATDGLLTMLQESAARLATAWRRSAGPCTVQAFRSRGRHHVEVLILGQDADRGPLHLPPGLLHGSGSTRLGAAIRHAAATARTLAPAQRRVLILTDGQPHDIDCHDPRYLVEDARQAVNAAQKAGIAVNALGCGLAAADPVVGRCLDHIFHPGSWAALGRLGDLPRQIAALA